jgi:UDP-N-acetylglucosamine--N-acetylmuramyl-(pentapeptide) pyrophosphoryl-undecaprenol N-acetylglucosamine transferase
VQIIWQCGKLYFEEYKKYNSPLAPEGGTSNGNRIKNVQVLAFIDRMDLVYAAADIVISRAGASSVSELCIVGKPVIFIPSPNVAEDHQTKNANSIVDKKGALMLKESELDAQFSLVFEALLKDQGKQNQLSENIKQLALPNATKDIVDEIVKLIEDQKL